MKYFTSNTDNRKNKGFTLVELIVVLVILAILAAILVPALLGYIDRAKEKQDLINAKNCLTAIQVQLTELYGENGGTVPEGTPILKPSDYWENKRQAKGSRDDVNATRMTMAENNESANKGLNGRILDDNVNTFAAPILETMESKGDDMKNGDPYCIVFAVGSNASNTKRWAPATKLHDKYTVYFLMYMKEKDSTPMFYYDGRWTTHYPDNLEMNSNNIVQSGSLKGKRLQFYTISNNTYNDLNKKGFGTTEFWNWVKSL